MQITTTIINKLGLHARAASKLVELASHFESDIQLDKGGQTVNGKSIMGVLMLAAPQHSEITLVIDGADQEQASQQLQQLIADRFGEDE